MALVQQELHDMKLQLEAGSSHRLTANDTQLCQRIEKLKERFRELLLHLRKRRAAESENAIILSEEVRGHGGCMNEQMRKRVAECNKAKFILLYIYFVLLISLGDSF